MRVQSRQCSTCIYRKDSPLDLAALESAVRDRHGHYTGYRICHHSKDAVCAGFHARHGANCTPIQIATRLGMLTKIKEER